MLRVAYHEALEGAEVDLGTLGALMIDALHFAVKSVEAPDAALSARIITGADQTAELGHRIESACIDLIWRQQPLADELRQVTGMFEISTDLQRINYYIVDIAKHAVRLADKSAANAPRETLHEVARLTEENLEAAVGGYAKRDLAASRKVLDADAHYEKLYSSGFASYKMRFAPTPTSSRLRPSFCSSLRRYSASGSTHRASPGIRSRCSNPNLRRRAAGRLFERARAVARRRYHLASAHDRRCAT